MMSDKIVVVLVGCGSYTHGGTKFMQDVPVGIEPEQAEYLLGLDGLFEEGDDDDIEFDGMGNTGTGDDGADPTMAHEDSDPAVPEGDTSTSGSDDSPTSEESSKPKAGKAKKPKSTSKATKKAAPTKAKSKPKSKSGVTIKKTKTKASKDEEVEL
jgi:hypothetical protein